MATWAKGVDFKNSANTARVGGVGIYGTDGSVEKAYLAVGTEPWNRKGLEVTSSAITFMGNNVYHAGNKPTPSEIGAAATSHGTHVTYSTTAPLANGTASAGTASTVARTDHVHPLQTTVSGNAGTATKLQTARTISVTGHATGSASFDGSANASIALTLANSGATAGSYGPSENTSATFGGTITIPQITVDAKGRVTSAVARTVTMPSNPNSDTKVTNTLNTTAKAYITGTTSATTNTGTQVFDTGVYLDTTAGKLVASTFAGALSGNATTATTLQTARTINGTSFNGSANITTANWGTARTITIGSTGKSVNGSGNISWSLSEIGAAAASHTHSSFTGAVGTTIAPSTGTGVIRYDYNVSSANAGTLPVSNNANGILTMNTHSGNYYDQLGFSSNGKLYYRHFNGAALDSTTAWNQIAFTNSSITGNAATATTLATARTIGKASFNGSANITLSQIMGYATTTSSGNGTYTNKWTKFATIDLSGGTYRECTGQLIFSSKETDAFGGTLQFYLRTGSAITSTSISLRWTELTNTDYAANIVAVKVSDGKFDLYFKPIVNYTIMNITALCQNVGYLTLHSNQSYVDSVTAASTSSLQAKAATAVTLQTARTINGTSFNGSANITTANWGTARTITIGSTGKSVNGSANVSWSLSEIGAAAASHTHNIISAQGIQTPQSDRTATSGLRTFSYYNNGGPSSYGEIISFGRGTSGHAELAVSWSGTPSLYVRSLRDTTDNWTSWFKVYHTGNKPTASDVGAAASSHTHNYAGSSSAGGAANTAVKLATARTISLGGILSGSASFDGSGNVTISAAANDITTITKSLTVTTSWADTGITGTNLGTGTYAVQMYVNDGTNTGHYQEYYSGTMSWYNGTTNSTYADEILLHKAGHQSNGRHIYLRTIRSANSGYLKLQISTTNAFTAASSIVFKFKKLI